MSKLRVAFLGTPDFAVSSLAALAEAGHEIACVYSQPPRPAGRGQRERPSPVQRLAEERGWPVRTPLTLRTPEEQEAFAALALDVAVVVAYGLILPAAVLDAPREGCFNVHASLLPRWRGAAPVQRAILAGDEKTGITIMQMEPGLDTGPMLAKAETPVDRKTAGELTAELADMGAKLMARVLADLPAFEPTPQIDALATYAAKIGKEEARIDWAASAEEIERKVRAFAPSPGAWFDLAGERVKLLQAELGQGSGEPGMILNDALTIACGGGAIRPARLQRAGKPAMDIADFLRGNPVAAGTVLR